MKHSRHHIKKSIDNTGEFIQKAKGKEFNNMGKKAVYDSGLIKDIMGLSDEAVEGIYGQAYLLYNTGKYSDAAEIFRLLIMLNSTEPKYVMGLAACFHMMKEFEGAASAYTLCSIIDPENPIPHFHSSDCYIQMGDKASAMVSLEMAVKRSGDKPEFATLRERAQITLQALKKEIVGASQVKS